MTAKQDDMAEGRTREIALVKFGRWSIASQCAKLNGSIKTYIFLFGRALWNVAS